MPVDILAIGAHPDDVELGCGGTLIKHIANGYSVAIVDLTRGELGTRGNAEVRLLEARKAADLLKIQERINLEMRDGFFVNDEAHQMELIEHIRFFQPKIILAPSVHDRHPDHGRAARLVQQACFLSGLIKIESDWHARIQSPWRAPLLLHYIQDYYHKPDIVVDISDYYEQKMMAVKAYHSQFYNPESAEPDTPISMQGFFDVLKARAIEYGRPIGCQYAEGFISAKILGTDNLFTLH